MKFVYKKRIVDQIVQEKFKADSAGHVIEKVILTYEEGEWLKSECWWAHGPNRLPAMVAGVPVEVLPKGQDH